MFEVGVVGTFEAQHHLRGEFGPASQPHAHTYRVDVGASGSTLQPDGTLFDLTRLQDALRAATDRLQGADLNAVDGLAEPNPSAEIVARYLFERIARALRDQPLNRLRVQVWESADAYASYSGDLV